MAGKNGSTWRHDWIPTNAQAALLKTHGRSSSFTAATAARPRAAARKPAPPVRQPAGTQSRSLSWVGKLKSGNVQGLTVAQEYHRKEVLGKYTANDHAVARAAGFKHPRDYQASITDHIARNGLINAPQFDAEDKTLLEGYHRYAAMRQLRQRRVAVKKIG